MVIHGHVENGVVIPHGNFSLPDGTEVTIVLRAEVPVADDAMTDDERRKYVEGLARIDAVENENPGDTFSGTDHDRILYG